VHCGVLGIGEVIYVKEEQDWVQALWTQQPKLGEERDALIATH